MYLIYAFAVKFVDWFAAPGTSVRDNEICSPRLLRRHHYLVTMATPDPHFIGKR